MYSKRRKGKAKVVAAVWGTEGKAKVVAAVWGTELIQFLATLL